jgi:hypothetical protein
MRRTVIDDQEQQSILSSYFRKIGSKGGRKSRGGGRPRIPDDQLTPAQRKRRERYLAELQRKQGQKPE